MESTLLKESPDLSLENGKILGGKTGFTDKAGLCLISIAEIKGDLFLLITMGAKGNSMTDARTIYQSIE